MGAPWLCLGALGDPLNGGKMLAFLPLPDDSLGTQGPPGGGAYLWVVPRITHWAPRDPWGGGICLCLGALGTP